MYTSNKMFKNICKNIFADIDEKEFFKGKNELPLKNNDDEEIMEDLIRNYSSWKREDSNIKIFSEAIEDWEYRHKRAKEIYAQRPIVCYEVHRKMKIDSYGYFPTREVAVELINSLEYKEGWEIRPVYNFSIEQIRELKSLGMLDLD